MKVKINAELIQNIAHLSRLELSGEAEQNMIQDMNNILAWIEKLDELDTNGVEPLTHISDEVNVLRADVVKDTISHRDALVNAPQKDASYFRVPKVLE
jgi:aspartyl-tRNA(Asn)/glutamyl-tRNA(Gln) amidotransferase subunit C